MALNAYDRQQLSAFSADPSGYQESAPIAPTFDANAQGTGWTSAMDAPRDGAAPLAVPLEAPPAAAPSPEQERMRAMILNGHTAAAPPPSAPLPMPTTAQMTGQAPPLMVPLAAPQRHDMGSYLRVPILAPGSTGRL